MVRIVIMVRTMLESPVFVKPSVGNRVAMPFTL